MLFSALMTGCAAFSGTIFGVGKCVSVAGATKMCFLSGIFPKGPHLSLVMNFEGLLGE